MNKFQVGDKVVCIARCAYDMFPGEVGKEYTVKSITSLGSLTLKEHPHMSCMARRFEKVEDETKPLDVTKPLMFRSPWPDATITYLATASNGQLVFEWKSKDIPSVPIMRYPSGRCFEGRESGMDVVNVPRKVVKHEKTFDIYIKRCRNGEWVTHSWARGTKPNGNQWQLCGSVTHTWETEE